MFMYYIHGQKTDSSFYDRGFAVGWDYAIGWLIILPFELTAASLTIQYWSETLNSGIWVAVFLVVLTAIQFFGVRGYGEGEKAFISLQDI